MIKSTKRENISDVSFEQSADSQMTPVLCLSWFKNKKARNLQKFKILYLLSTHFLWLVVLLTALLLAMVAMNAFAEIEMPKEQQVGDIVFITGGIGEEAEMMRGVVKEFPLEIVLIQKSNARETFLADINVQLLDAQKNLVLNTTSEGPYLYVKLPAGQYWVLATFNEETKRQRVLVRPNQHQKMVFWWPVADQLQIEESAPEDEEEAEY